MCEFFACVCVHVLYMCVCVLAYACVTSVYLGVCDCMFLSICLSCVPFCKYIKHYVYPGH